MKRVLTICFVFFLSVIPVFAGGGQETSEADTQEGQQVGSSDKAVTIELWAIGGGVGEALSQLVESFNESQDQYLINYVDKGAYRDVLQAGIAAYRADEHPVVMQVLAEGASDMLLSGAIYPAYELMSDMSIQINWDDYLDPIASFFATRDGQFLAFPFNHSTNVMYLNMTKLKAAGVTDVPSTWEEVEVALEAMVENGEERPFAYRPWGWNDLAQFSAVHGIPIATNSNGFTGLDTELVFNKTKHVEHLADMKRWIDEGLSQLRDDYFAVSADFGSGGPAILLASSASHARLAEAARGENGFEFVTAKLPVYEGFERHNSLAGGGGMFVLKGHDEPEYRGAAQFFNFLRQVETQRRWSSLTGYVPVTHSAFEALQESGFYEQEMTDGRQTAVESVLDSEMDQYSRGFRLGNYLQIEAIWDEEVLNVMNGEKQPQEAMDDAVRRGNELLDRYAQLHEGKDLP